MAYLRLFYGQRFESHTFQVLFDPLKGLKAAIIKKTIKIYLKYCSREVSAKKKKDLLSEGVPITVHWKNMIIVCSLKLVKLFLESVVTF